MKSTAKKLHDYRMKLRLHYVSMLPRVRRSANATSHPKPSRAPFPGILGGMLDKIDAEELKNHEHDKAIP